MIHTGEDGGHHGGEHKKEQSEEKESGIVVGLGGLIANVEIEQTNEDTTDHVTSQPQTSQCLRHQHSNNQFKRIFNVAQLNTGLHAKHGIKQRKYNKSVYVNNCL